MKFKKKGRGAQGKGYPQAGRNGLDVASEHPVYESGRSPHYKEYSKHLYEDSAYSPKHLYERPAEKVGALEGVAARQAPLREFDAPVSRPSQQVQPSKKAETASRANRPASAAPFDLSRIPDKWILLCVFVILACAGILYSIFSSAACSDEYGTCADGSTFLNRQCVNGNLSQVYYVRDPCSGKPVAPAPTTSVVDVLSDDAVYSCQSDYDCVLVKGDCCGCAMGGKETAISKLYSGAWEAYWASKCDGTACAAVYGCADGLSAVCRNARCAAVSAVATPVPTASVKASAPSKFYDSAAALSALVQSELGLPVKCVNGSVYRDLNYYCVSDRDAQTGMVNYSFSLRQNVLFPYSVAAGYENAEVSGRPVRMTSESGITSLQVFCANYTYKVAAAYPSSQEQQYKFSEKLAGICSK